MSIEVYHKLYDQVGDITIDKMELIRWLGTVSAAIMHDRVNINYYINIIGDKLECTYGEKEGFTLVRIKENMNIVDLGLDDSYTVKDMFKALKLWFRLDMVDNILFNDLEMTLSLYIHEQRILINKILETIDIVSDYFQDKKLCDLEVAYEALV